MPDLSQVSENASCERLSARRNGMRPGARSATLRFACFGFGKVRIAASHIVGTAWQNSAKLCHY
eukprot:1926965-Pyramimonas_sp.AAC.1